LGLNASPKLLQAPSARRLRRSCFLRQLSELGAPSLQAALDLAPQVGQSLVILALNLRHLGFGIRLRLVELGGPFREVLLDLPPALITPCHGPPSNGSSGVRAVDRQTGRSADSIQPGGYRSTVFAWRVALQAPDSYRNFPGTIRRDHETL